MLDREESEFHTARHSGLVENIGDVMFDRVLADSQLSCDSPIRFARGDECKHVMFTGRQMNGRFRPPVVVAARGPLVVVVAHERLDDMGEVLPSHPEIALEYGPDAREQLLNG